MTEININEIFQRAFLKCEQVTKSHYENFPVGSVLIPKEKRKYVYAVYSFARYADDIADSGELDATVKVVKLNALDVELDKVENKKLDELEKETEYIFLALYKTLDDLRIPIYELRNLLIAFMQDSVKDKYETFDELIEYSKYSANPIGHLILYLFGYTDKKLFELSDYICTGLQLINFWQDVERDLKINRVYIPNEVMKKFNYSYELLNNKVENENYIELIKYLSVRTKEHFEKGKELPYFVNGRLKLELKAIYNGGLTILNKIEKLNYRTLSSRPVITSGDKIKILLKAFF